MNQIRLIFFLCFSFILVPVIAQYKVQGHCSDNTYLWSPDIDETEIVPMAIHGDTVLIIRVEPFFSFGEDEETIYFYDLIINKDFSQDALSFMKEKDYKGISFEDSLKDAWAEIMTPWYFFSDIVSEWAPHGYIEEFSWYKDVLGYAHPEITFCNTNKKTIKYISFYINYFNPVEDPIRAGFSNSYDCIYTGIGPVENEEIVSWNFKDVDYFIKNASTAMIKKVVIEYMDKTKYTLIKELKFREY